MNKKIVAIILVVFGAFVLFGCTQTDSGNNTAPPTGGTDMANTQPPAGGSTGPVNLSENKCDYFTLDMVKSVVKTPVVFDTAGAKVMGTSISCAYIEDTPKGKIVAFFMVVSQAFPANGIDKQVTSAVNNGGQEISGIGERAWVLKRSTSTADDVTLYFYKSGILASVKVRDGVSYEDSQAKAEQLAKLVVAKLP
jgi:hypothetical protein